MAAEGAYPVNSRDIESNYGPAFFDARHIISLAGSYELPFGKDRKMGSDWNRAVDAVAGGWGGQLRRHARTPGFPSRCRTASGARCRAPAPPSGRT